jgi:hypothetical protein
LSLTCCLGGDGHSWKVAPALATGCSIVFKPAELTPLSTLVCLLLSLFTRCPQYRIDRSVFLQKVAELFIAAGFPPGAYNVVNGMLSFFRPNCRSTSCFSCDTLLFFICRTWHGHWSSFGGAQRHRQDCIHGKHAHWTCHHYGSCKFEPKKGDPRARCVLS